MFSLLSLESQSIDRVSLGSWSHGGLSIDRAGGEGPYLSGISVKDYRLVAEGFMLKHNSPVETVAFFATIAVIYVGLLPRCLYDRIESTTG